MKAKVKVVRYWIDDRGLHVKTRYARDNESQIYGTVNGEEIVEYESHRGNYIILPRNCVTMVSAEIGQDVLSLPKHIRGLVYSKLPGGTGGYKLINDVIQIADTYYLNTPENLDYYRIIKDGRSYRIFSPKYSYHERERNYKIDNSKANFGFEIEKSQMPSTGLIDRETAYKYDGVIIESDGTVIQGFELITPPLPKGNKINKLIQKYESYINVSDIRNAGGHACISLPYCNGIRTFYSLINWLPIIAAIYHDRLDNNYCKISNMNEPTVDRRAFCTHNNYLEIRCSSAIQDSNDLLRRIDLLNYIAEHSNKSFASTINCAKKCKLIQYDALASKVKTIVERYGTMEQRKELLCA